MRGRTESMLFGTAKRLHSKSDLNIWTKEHLMHFVISLQYLGVLLDPSLNMKEHFRKAFKNAAKRVKLLKRMRQSLASYSAEPICKQLCLPKMLYCSTPISKFCDAMDTRFEYLQKKSHENHLSSS